MLLEASASMMIARFILRLLPRILPVCMYYFLVRPHIESKLLIEFNSVVQIWVCERVFRINEMSALHVIFSF